MCAAGVRNDAYADNAGHRGPTVRHEIRKKLFGGVDEADVWKKLEQLQQTYQLVYDEQAAYYQALLDERDQALARLMGRRGDAHE